jgi:adenine phosphoribosyltransferase
MAIDLKNYIIDVPDFPKPGIVFKDITPVVQSAQAFNAAIDGLAAWAAALKPEIVAGIESRGFLFAAGLARDLRLGLTVIRKKGKLPRRAVSVEAPNEYAVEQFEMHEDAVARGHRHGIVVDQRHQPRRAAQGRGHRLRRRRRAVVPRGRRGDPPGPSGRSGPHPGPVLGPPGPRPPGRGEA